MRTLSEDEGAKAFGRTGRIKEGMKKAVIFDLDGTLANTLESLLYSVNLTMEDCGLPPIDRDDCRRFVGDGAEKLIERCVRHGGENGKERILQTYKVYKSHFAQHFLYQVEPYEGIRELLVELKQRGMKLAVLSNKAHERTTELIETVFGEYCFDEVAGLKPQIARKPSPDGVFEICKRLNIRPEEAVYVGDTSTDMETGRSAGCVTVGVLWGFREEQELKEHQADVIISAPQELLDYLE